jgi:hypothetical protein
MIVIESLYIVKRLNTESIAKLWIAVTVSNCICIIPNVIIANSLFVFLFRMTNIYNDDYLSRLGQAANVLILLIISLIFVIVAYLVSWRIKYFFLKRIYNDDSGLKKKIQYANRWSYLIGVIVGVSMLISYLRIVSS